MLADPNRMLSVPNHRYKRFEASLEEALTPEPARLMSRIINYNASINVRFLENVTSMNRVPNPNRRPARLIADRYFCWLGGFTGFLINIERKGSAVYFKVGRVTLIHLERENNRSCENRELYLIRGGVLARRKTFNGRLEFRNVETVGTTLIALLDYRPSIPWFIYKCTQALVHVIVMGQFSKNIKANPS